MNILGIMQAGLFLIMNALLYPVIALLLCLVVAALFILGGFLSEFAFRRGRGPDTDQASERLAAQVSKQILAAKFEDASECVSEHIGKSGPKSRLVRDFMKDFALQVGKGKDNLAVRAEKSLQQYEIVVTALLDKTRMMIRIGPMLGLMGTLIPMGPALLALTNGDLKQMADCLIIAFGTTVAGLAIGALAYWISIVRERWYAQDLKDMEYLIDLTIGHLEDNDSQPEEQVEQKATVVPMARG